MRFQGDIELVALNHRGTEPQRIHRVGRMTQINADENRWTRMTWAAPIAGQIPIGVYLRSSAVSFFSVNPLWLGASVVQGSILRPCIH
jgi:hypothetical protein